jgi:hypothetical protein
MTLFLLKEQHKVFEDVDATSRRFPTEAISTAMPVQDNQFNRQLA